MSVFGFIQSSAKATYLPTMLGQESRGGTRTGQCVKKVLVFSGVSRLFSTPAISKFVQCPSGLYYPPLGGPDGDGGCKNPKRSANCSSLVVSKGFV